MRQSQKLYKIYPEIMAGSDDELGFGDAKEDAPVRHFVDYSGVRGAVNIPASLKNFNSFIQNDSKRRISFRVANGTSFRKAFSTVRYSTDPQIHEFNRIFTEANRNIDYKGVKTYDAIDYETARNEGSNTFAVAVNTAKNSASTVTSKVVDESAKKAGSLFTLLLWGGAGYIALKTMGQSGKQSKRR